MEHWILLAAVMLLTGGIAGVLAGLFGIGGGIVIVPVLEGALGILGVDPAIRMHVAVATSLATIVPTSIASARAHHRRNAVDSDIVRRGASVVLRGALLGTWFAAQRVCGRRASSQPLITKPRVPGTLITNPNSAAVPTAR
jgi:uncharacterized membrane protein YfcA